jgi:two-component system NarL family sensor kinase
MRLGPHWRAGRLAGRAPAARQVRALVLLPLLGALGLMALAVSHQDRLAARERALVLQTS